MDRRPHIVVVEDEVVQRQMLADYLTRQNFRVSGLPDGAALRRLVGDDEEGTLARLRALRRALIYGETDAHRGRVVRVMGDGFLIEFSSAIDALRCAMALQRGMAVAADEPAERRLQFRVGINVGDVLVDGDDILGDSVNIAARLEGIAEPGGICLSAAAYEQVRGKLDIAVADIGEPELKNIARPVRAYRLLL